MEVAVKNTSGREVVLYGGLLLIFVSAWLSDYRPDLAVVALSLAIAVAAVEVCALYVLARRSRTAKEGAKVELFPPVVISSANKNALLSPIAVRSYLDITERRLARRALDSVAIDTAMRDYLIHRAMMVRMFERELPIAASNIPDELAKWTIAVRNKNSFSVTAGPFEIDLFHGHYNIRVLDPSTVTVQGIARDDDGCEVPAALRAPTFQ